MSCEEGLFYPSHHGGEVPEFKHGERRKIDATPVA